MNKLRFWKKKHYNAIKIADITNNDEVLNRVFEIVALTDEIIFRLETNSERWYK